MLAKESVKSRLQSKEGISFTVCHLKVIFSDTTSRSLPISCYKPRIFANCAVITVVPFKLVEVTNGAILSLALTSFTKLVTSLTNMLAVSFVFI